MSGKNLEKRVAELEKQVGALLAGGERAKDWRRTRGAFSGDELMQQIFAEGRKMRDAERKRARSGTGNKRTPRS